MSLFSNMRKYKLEKRELVNAGCQWRNLPHDFPPIFTVHSFYRRARLNGLWDKILEHIVKLTVAGLNENPTQALIDSQSVKINFAAEQKGFDMEKTKGVKRQIITDEIGCLLAVAVHRANLHDTEMGYWAFGLANFTYPTLKKICGDGGYRGSFVYETYKYFGLRVEISKKLKPHGWQVLPKRWRVERTFAWLNHSRRLSKDYEFTLASTETLIKLSHIHTLLKRL